MRFSDDFTRGYVKDSQIMEEQTDISLRRLWGETEDILTQLSNLWQRETLPVAVGFSRDKVSRAMILLTEAHSTVGAELYRETLEKDKKCGD